MTGGPPVRWIPISQVASAFVVYGDGDQSLLTLINDYAARVLKFHSDLDLDLDYHEFTKPAHFVWNAYDLVGMMYLRDAIESGLNQLKEPSENVQIASPTVVDEFFRIFSTEWPELQIISLLGMSEQVGTGWWWRMVPERGPVLQELSEFGFPARQA